MNLLHQMTLDPGQAIPWGIKHDLLEYFSDLSKVKYIARNKKLVAQVQADLPILATISTKAAYPESALLPEPEEDKPDATRGLTAPVPASAPAAVPVAPAAVPPAAAQPQQ